MRKRESREGARKANWGGKMRQTERKGRVDVGEKRGGKEIWGSKTLGKKQCALLHLVKGRKPC